MITIGKPWAHASQPGYIHYMATLPDGTKRRLYARREGGPGNVALYDLLETMLAGEPVETTDCEPGDPAAAAYDKLIYATDVAARRALGNGLDRESVAAELDSLADAIRDPGSVAENMEPIMPGDPDPDPDVVLNR